MTLREQTCHRRSAVQILRSVGHEEPVGKGEWFTSSEQADQAVSRNDTVRRANLGAYQG